MGPETVDLHDLLTFQSLMNLVDPITGLTPNQAQDILRASTYHAASPTALALAHRTLLPPHPRFLHAIP